MLIRRVGLFVIWIFMSICFSVPGLMEIDHPEENIGSYLPDKDNTHFIEGDIIIPGMDMSEDGHNRRTKRKMTTNVVTRWKNPIYFSFDGTHSASDREQIRTAVHLWSALTCVNFVELPQWSELNNSAIFTKRYGCASFIGYHYPGQRVSLNSNCLKIGTIVHEVGHLLGFWHEQSRPDRDDYVTIKLENVINNKVTNFNKASWQDVTNLGVPYDLGSVMHYGPKYFTKNLQPTIVAHDNNMQKTLGQRGEPSFYDVKLANLVYCADYCRFSSLSCQHGGYPDPRNCSRCRCPPGFGGRVCETAATPQSAICDGGVRHASPTPHTLESPQYPYRYTANHMCSWLIQGPKGSTIILTFLDSFNLTCDRMTGACEDYVEVRYSADLALTGARFCCNERPYTPLQSAHNEMLVLFRSQSGGSGGFRAQYYTGWCGGCGVTTQSEQPACVRQVAYRCQKSWKVLVRKTCTAWWMWSDKLCGVQYKIKSREEICRRTEKYCCENFRLNNGICTAISSVTAAVPNPGTEVMVDDEGAVWSEWSDWGPCSKPCGGCGVHSRKRTCLRVQDCSREKTQEESRMCNTHVCPGNFAQVCKKTVSYRKLCNPWTFKMCTMYKTEMVVCHNLCCEGYVQVNNMCVRGT